MVIEKGNIYLCKKDVIKNGQTLFHKGVKYRCISDNVLIGTSGISYYTTSLNPDFYFTYIGPIPKDEAFIKSSENAPIDNINHPSHYSWLKDKCGIEVIDIIRHLDFDLGNAIKYILRAGRKGDTIEDLKKAIWYLNDKIKILEDERAKDYSSGSTGHTK